jgi:hypothetical protein
MAPEEGEQRGCGRGVMIGVVGIVASLASSDVMSAFALFCMAWGVINVTAGGITFWRFSVAYERGTQ